MTLGDLKLRVADLGYVDVAASDLIRHFLNQAQRRLHGIRRWPWMEASTTIPTVINTSAYSLAAIPNLGIDAARIETLSPNDNGNLDWLTPQDLRNRLELDQLAGRPQFWTVWDESVLLYPKPDAVYTLRLDYLVIPPDLQLDGDVPVFPSVYHEILVWGAVSNMAYRQRDVAGKQMADAEWNLRVQEMIRAIGIKQRQSSPQVRSSGLYDGGLYRDG